MEMRMREDAEMGTDLTPPLPPLASSLHDSHLRSHCSACFSPLPPTLLFNSNPNPSFLRYCSPPCSDSDSPLHFSSAEHHLFLLLLRHSHPSTSHFSADSSDLRAALRLLRILRLPPLRTQPLHRFRGLLTNRHKFISPSHDPESDDDETLTRIRDGGKAMAVARCMRDGTEFSGDSRMEEALLCLVLTNAVEVQVNGGSALGIAVYDWCFSWINHSCSPNACYRFLPCSPETPLFSGESRLQIVPGGNDEIEIENAVRSRSESIEGCNIYGPRIIVRSIKAIKKGEEVWVAYIDLLQPKAIRHAQLWVMYRFSCCCSRCNASPPTYVDHVLQENLAQSLNYKDEEIRKLTDYVDDAIADYLSVGNPEACCEMLENVLAHGLPDEQLEPTLGKSPGNIRLHPLHYLSLATYTTLASAYRVRASQFLGPHSETEGNELGALSLSKASTAYSLLLAGATHHLFLSDSSLIASTANFWMNAGESILSLARSSLWISFVKGRLPAQSHKCDKCSLADKFEVNSIGSEAHNGRLENISKRFVDCISSITPKVWSSLIRAHHLCKIFEGPSDSNRLGKMGTSKIWDFLANSGVNSMDSWSQDEESISGYEAERDTNQERINLFKLGIHCLLYGGFLSSICYGPSSYLTRYIRNLLDAEESLTGNSSHEMD